ncbi:E3 ubiquitin-protein ligase MARCH11, partial [Trichinella nativa]
YCGKNQRAYRRTAANKPPISQTSKPVPVVVRQLVLTSLVDLIQEGRHETRRGSSQLFTELCTTTRTSSHVDIHTVRRILTWSHSVECSSVMPTNEENQIKAENVGEDPSCCDCSSAFLLNMPLPSENSQLLAVEQPLFVGGISQLGESKESIATSSNGSQSLCRICHLPAARGNPLITPCRCSGSLRHVHKTCLLHWLEISSTKVSPSPQCELCGYTYKTHHCFSFRTAQCPHCTRRDCTLHLVFIAMLMLMSSCAFISVLYLSQDDGLRTRNILNRQDITVISCSLLFFVAFFVAIFTQYRSETSLFCLFARCWLINRHWRIKNYNPNSEIKKDDVNI